MIEPYIRENVKERYTECLIRVDYIPSVNTMYLHNCKIKKFYKNPEIGAFQDEIEALMQQLQFKEHCSWMNDIDNHFSLTYQALFKTEFYSRDISNTMKALEDAACNTYLKKDDSKNMDVHAYKSLINGDNEYIFIRFGLTTFDPYYFVPELKHQVFIDRNENNTWFGPDGQPVLDPEWKNPISDEVLAVEAPTPEVDDAILEPNVMYVEINSILFGQINSNIHMVLDELKAGEGVYMEPETRTQESDIEFVKIQSGVSDIEVYTFDEGIVIYHSPTIEHYYVIYLQTSPSV